MILQPDRLSRACLHLSVSFSHPLHPCPPPPFPGVHAVIAAPFTSSSYYRPLSVLPSPTPPHVPSHFRNLDFFFSKIPVCGAAGLSASFLLGTSRLPGHSCPSTFLRALQTVPGPCSVFLHLPSFIHPPPACSGSPCGSAHGIRCSLYSSRIQGAPGLPVGRGDPPLQTTLRLEPDSDLSGWPVLGCCM